MATAQAQGKKENTRPEVVTLPADVVDLLPAKAAVQLYDMGIFNNDIKRFDICWSPARARIIVPVYKYALGSNGAVAKKLVGLMGRKLDDKDENTDKPKWWSVRQKDIKHPRYIALPEPVLYDRQVVIVEDIFSAIRISNTGRISVALMTTYLPYELYPVLNNWDVHLWLDADAYTKSVKYQAALGANGITASTIYTDKDPKWYTGPEIEEAILNGRLS
jgi:hypothetical protein